MLDCLVKRGVQSVAGPVMVGGASVALMVVFLALVLVQGVGACHVTRGRNEGTHVQRSTAASDEVSGCLHDWRAAVVSLV